MPHVPTVCRLGDSTAVTEARFVVTPDTMVALRKLLIGRDFATLEARFAAYDSAAAGNIRDEDAWLAAYRTFHTPIPELSPYFDEWVKASPDSPYPRIARAYHRVAKRAAAGTEIGDDAVPDKGEDRVTHWTLAALKDIRHGLAQPEPHVQYFLAHAILTQGDMKASRRALDSALSRSPFSYVIRAQYARTMRPTWGGDEDTLRAFVERAQQHVDHNPRLGTLLGYPAWDVADRIHRELDTLGALKQLNTAIGYGAEVEFNGLRGVMYYWQRKYHRAIRDFDCALALGPWRTQYIGWRAAAKIKLGAAFDGERAIALQRDGMRDLAVAQELDPYSEHNRWVLRATALDLRQDLVQEFHGTGRSAWRTLKDIFWGLSGWGLFAFASFANVLVWRRQGYYIPRYIHVLAAIAFGVIVWLNWMWVQAGGAFTIRRAIIVLLFPTIVYFFHITYGGAIAAYQAASRVVRRVN